MANEPGTLGRQFAERMRSRLPTPAYGTAQFSVPDPCIALERHGGWNEQQTYGNLAWMTAKLQGETLALRRAQGCTSGVVRFFGSLRIGPFHAFVLERGHGDMLERVLTARAETGSGLGPMRARGIVEQVLVALSWLHSNGIVHGYVAPQ